ncbi:MAG: restriction endonuclease subunit S [Candidatus Kuenenia sp.]|nr:restriction endonuclease subunit S [Candidatus Kuenenia sp.]
MPSKYCLDNGVHLRFAGTTELHVIRPFPETILPYYIWSFLKTPDFSKEGESKMTGSAGQKRVPKNYVKNKPFPLPPLNEQKPIIQRVEQLMKLCDELEEKVKQSQKDSEQLMQVVLYESFEINQDEFHASL